LCCWTGIPLPEINKETALDSTVLAKITEVTNKPNQLLLRRLSSDSVTITQIKNYVRKLKTEGTKIDMVVIDYIDCVLPEHDTENISVDEGKTMRKFESMCHELDVAGVCCTQGNRSAISSDIVTSDQTGGSIKKLQVGHMVISIAKTLIQKEQGLATMAILKSRVSKDGLVFENCIFDNAKMEISTDQSETFLGFEDNKTKRNLQRAREVYQNKAQTQPINNTQTNN
jgi:hypothetical protein